MTVRDRRRVLADAGAEVPAEAKAEALRVAGRLGAGPLPPAFATLLRDPLGGSQQQRRKRRTLRPGGRVRVRR
jgi:hypothetical protein